MKKTQLRNIIRESIKELMTEQIPPLGKAIMYKACGNPQAVGSGRKFTINDNGTLRDPIIGDFFCISDSPNMNNWFVTNGCIMEVVSFHWNQNATTTSTVNFLPNAVANLLMFYPFFGGFALYFILCQNTLGCL